jgi:hypothetical protein
MPKVCYVSREFAPKTLEVIKQANAIIRTYRAQGYDLTLRQLYYQFVSRDLIANKQSEYKRLGSIVSDARRAGLIDWDAIVDRTRNLQSLGHWDSPASIIEEDCKVFRYDLWENQPKYVEVWFEKDALMGVFERAANRLRVPFFSCRGYASDSEVWSAAMRLKGFADEGKHVVVLHFGDHDPSGIDMTRDITDRLELFSHSADIEVRRLALNMDQIRQYEPPPNPAKDTDSRFAGYRALYGDESWELDALEPQVLADLVETEVNELIDLDQWTDDTAREKAAREQLQTIASKYDDVVQHFCEA